MITLRSPWEWWELEPTATSKRVLFQTVAHDSERNKVEMFGGILEIDKLKLELAKTDIALYAVLNFFDKARDDNDIQNMPPLTVMIRIAESASNMFNGEFGDHPGVVTLVTPEEWLKREQFSHITILDPDGWDRTNFEEDWNIPISESDMDKKVCMSTVMIRRK